MERQAIAAQQRYVIYAASGNYEMRGDEPTVRGALEEFDYALEAEPAVDERDPRDRELFELMGVGRA